MPLTDSVSVMISHLQPVIKSKHPLLRECTTWYAQTTWNCLTEIQLQLFDDIGNDYNIQSQCCQYTPCDCGHKNVSLYFGL